MLYQLSYFRISLFLSGDFGVGLRIFGQSFTEVNSFPHRLSALNSSRNKLRTPLSQCFFRATSAPELWEKMDSNHRRYKPADLQSAPFGHSGILPFYVSFPRWLRPRENQLQNSKNWADGGNRTHDPEITNHVLWPTELHRHFLSWPYVFRKGLQR